MQFINLQKAMLLDLVAKAKLKEGNDLFGFIISGICCIHICQYASLYEPLGERKRSFLYKLFMTQ